MVEKTRTKNQELWSVVQQEIEAYKSQKKEEIDTSEQPQYQRLKKRTRKDRKRTVIIFEKKISQYEDTGKWTSVSAIFSITQLLLFALVYAHTFFP